jgi:hypothetical protein
MGYAAHATISIHSDGGSVVSGAKIPDAADARGLAEKASTAPHKVTAPAVHQSPAS